MRSKTLKLQLLFLFTLGLLALTYSYFQANLPDHLYRISSNSIEINYFAYYFTSGLAFIGFHTGSWIFISFVVFLIGYTAFFSRRNYHFDMVMILFFLLATLGNCFFFKPILVGEGPLFLLKKIPDEYLVLSTVVANLIVLVGTFRSTSRQSLIQFFQLIKNMGNPLKRLGNGFLKIFQFLEVLSKPAFYFKKIYSKLDEHLRSSKKKNPQVTAESPSEDEVPEFEYIENETEEIQLELGISGLDSSELNDKKIRKRKKAAKQSNQFKSNELIACIKNKRNFSVDTPAEIYFQDIIEKIEDKLKEFNVNARVINILKGPVVDTFELELGVGIKVSRITSLTEDLSLALKGAPLRMIYPLKGKSTVGLEVPRNPREVIFLDEILGSINFKSTRYKLPLAIGKNAFGNVSVVDLAEMPHMLVAGSTGSGKSVFINTILVSLLVKKNPKDLKLILIDPKQLELALYATLPHLSLPVVTDPKMASLALLWACQEMEKRYSILKEAGVRNIEGYNKKVDNPSDDLNKRLSGFFVGEDDFQLPYLVIIVDEFADLILTKHGKEIEINICKLAAKARAAGIHLVLATQRPSVDVITGLIKTNFPTRVSFRMSSSIDSRTILQATGAEKLLGKGDMLFQHRDGPERLHASYVDEDEIEVLVDRLADLPSEYDHSAMDFIDNEGPSEEQEGMLHSAGFALDKTGDVDPLFDEAIKVVQEYKQASASMLQRRLKIGYNRAANLVELLESKGIVGPQQGSKPREVFFHDSPS